jgi:hypothetical protein
MVAGSTINSNDGMRLEAQGELATHHKMGKRSLGT